jgi:hypothetical protein
MLPSTSAEPTIVGMEPISEEEINMDDVSSSSTESNEECMHDDTTPPSLNTDPLYHVEEQEKLPSTADIRHFFERTSEGTVCSYCK